MQRGAHRRVSHSLPLTGANFPVQAVKAGVPFSAQDPLKGQAPQAEEAGAQVRLPQRLQTVEVPSKEREARGARAVSPARHRAQELRFSLDGEAVSKNRDR